MPKLGLDRQQLARILQNNAEAIRAFEKVFDSVESTPTTIEEAAALAGTAAALGNLAISLIASYASLLEQISAAPAPIPDIAVDDFSPAIALGTISQQNADMVELTGGTIDGTGIGTTTPSTGSFTTVSASGAVKSGVTGTAGLLQIARASDGLLVGTDTMNLNVREITNQAGDIVYIRGAAEKLRVTATGAKVSGALTVDGGAVALITATALTNGAAAAAGTLANAPAAGNPTKWIGINDNGTVRYIPAW